MRAALNAMGVAAVALGAAVPGVASACGGFFCNQEPMDQNRERIVFAFDEVEQVIDVHVQIFYTGNAQEFAWVVPVPAEPELGTGSDELFRVLDQVTAPAYQLAYDFEGDCAWYADEDDAVADGAETDAPPSGGGLGGEGVTVVAQEQVGPYETVTLSATGEEALITWLQDNGYDLPDAITPKLAPYVADGSFFVALRLSNDKDAGDIVPLTMRYDGDTASIPLELTSIAATPDMRLEPYVLADRRAVPSNYLHVQVNEAAVNWLTFGSNYADVISKAADQAGGQAFATDYSGSTERLRDRLWFEGMVDVDALRPITDPQQFVETMLFEQQWPRGSQQLLGLLEAYVPRPQAAIDAGVQATDFYNFPSGYAEYYDLIADFDPEAFADALEEGVVEPLQAAQRMVDAHDTLTRLTSSMDPAEMDRDPMFTLNADMPPVSNEHLATIVYDCTTTDDPWQAPRRIELEDGRVILVPSESWIWDNGGPEAFWERLENTAALVIEQTSSAGLPTILQDLSGEAGDDLDGHNDAVSDITGQPWNDDTAEPYADGCTGCSGAGPRGATGGALLAGLVGLLGLRRRR